MGEKARARRRVPRATVQASWTDDESRVPVLSSIDHDVITHIHTNANECSLVIVIEYPNAYKNNIYIHA